MRFLDPVERPWYPLDNLHCPKLQMLFAPHLDRSRLKEPLRSLAPAQILTAGVLYLTLGVMTFCLGPKWLPKEVVQELHCFHPFHHHRRILVTPPRRTLERSRFWSPHPSERSSPCLRNGQCGRRRLWRPRAISSNCRYGKRCSSPSNDVIIPDSYPSYRTITSPQSVVCTMLAGCMGVAKWKGLPYSLWTLVRPFPLIKATLILWQWG